MKQLTLFDLSKVEDGARVVFAVPFDIFPDAMIPAGTLATVKENGLNEIWSAILVLPDDTTLRDKLREWDGCIHINGGDPGCHEGDPEFAAEWLKLSPLAIAPDPAAGEGFHKHFPDYPASDMPALPQGFEDTSWHNDACPSYSNEFFCIWIDYLDASQREHEGGKRFIVAPMRDAIEATGPSLDSDDWNEVTAFVAANHGWHCRHTDTGRGVCAHCGNPL